MHDDPTIRVNPEPTPEPQQATALFKAAPRPGSDANARRILARPRRADDGGEEVREKELPQKDPAFVAGKRSCFCDRSMRFRGEGFR